MESTKSATLLAIALLLLAVSFGGLPFARAQTFPKTSIGPAFFVLNSAPVTISNTILEGTIETGAGGTGIGTYTIGTGAGHPNPNQSILFGSAGSNPWSSFDTIHVTDTGRDYVTTTNSPTADTGFTMVGMDTLNPKVSSTSTSVIITWVTLEKLQVTQQFQVTGTNMTNTLLAVSTSINNLDSVAHTVGVRYDWDLTVAGWDGSWLRTWTSGTASSWLNVETVWAPPSYDKWETVNYPSQPVFNIFGLFSPTPSKIIYASWPSSFSTAYSYTPSNQVIGCSTPSSCDDTVLTYWGPSTISPGGSLQSLIVKIPPPLNPAPSFSFTPTNPNPGQPVTFTGAATGGTPPYTFNWTFGDGGSAAGSRVTHIFAGGTHNVTLIATDSVANQGTTIQSITMGSVGGQLVLINKLALLAPYIGFASGFAAAIVVTAVYLKRVMNKKTGDDWGPA